MADTIGQKLAEKLGFKFYDKELIYKAAEMSGISPDILKEVDEKAASSLLYSLSLGASSIVHGFSGTAQLPINDRVFIAQQKLIKEYANSNCIIVGIRNSTVSKKFHPFPQDGEGVARRLLAGVPFSLGGQVQAGRQRPAGAGQDLALRVDQALGPHQLQGI